MRNFWDQGSQLLRFGLPECVAMLGGLGFPDVIPSRNIRLRRCHWLDRLSRRRAASWCRGLPINSFVAFWSGERKPGFRVQENITSTTVLSALACHKASGDEFPAGARDSVGREAREVERRVGRDLNLHRRVFLREHHQ